MHSSYVFVPLYAEYSDKAVASMFTEQKHSHKLTVAEYRTCHLLKHFNVSVMQKFYTKS